MLHLALERAADWRLIARNPAAAKLDLPRMARPRMTTWTVEEACRFLGATAEERLGVLWALMLSSGLRRGEVLGLRWEELDLDAARLAVTQTVVVAGGRPLVSEPKTWLADAPCRSTPPWSQDCDVNGADRRRSVSWRARHLARHRAGVHHRPRSGDPSREVVPDVVEFEVAVPRLRPAGW